MFDKETVIYLVEEAYKEGWIDGKIATEQQKNVNPLKKRLEDWNKSLAKEQIKKVGNRD